MNFRTARLALLAAVFALATSIAGFAQAPCGVANQIYCQAEDGTGTYYTSQNDTNPGGFGNYATAYDNFTLTGNYAWDVESFHWVGGYFNPPTPSTITAWTLTFYNDAAGIPGNAIATWNFAGNGNETLLDSGSYKYSLYFPSFDVNPGTYWASVVPDIGYPPQWGWATSATGNSAGYECYLGSCAPIVDPNGNGVNLAFALDGRAVPEPGTLALLGSGILGMVGTLRRKLC